MDLMVEKYRFCKERYFKQIIFRSDKIMAEFGRKRSCLKRIRGYNTGEEGGGIRLSFAS